MVSQVMVFARVAEGGNGKDYEMVAYYSDAVSGSPTRNGISKIQYREYDASHIPNVKGLMRIVALACSGT